MLLAGLFRRASVCPRYLSCQAHFAALGGHSWEPLFAVAGAAAPTISFAFGGDAALVGKAIGPSVAGLLPRDQEWRSMGCASVMGFGDRMACNDPTDYAHPMAPTPMGYGSPLGDGVPAATLSVAAMQRVAKAPWVAAAATIAWVAATPGQRAQGRCVGYAPIGWPECVPRACPKRCARAAVCSVDSRGSQSFFWMVVRGAR